MTLENFVKLIRDVEKVIRVTRDSYRVEPRTIKDPKTGLVKTINVAAMDVYEEDGSAVRKTFSTPSEKLATTLKVMHDNGTLYNYRIGIKQVGEGFAREYAVRIVP